MFHLKTFPFQLGQTFIVGDLLYKSANLGAEKLLDIFRLGFRIFDRVVENCSNEGRDISYLANAGQDLRDRYGMIDIRGGINILPALMSMFFSGEVSGPQQQGQFVLRND